MKKYESPYGPPSKIVCLAYNYLDLTEGEKKKPLVFFKPPSAIIRHNQYIRIPKRGAHVWPEVELAILIGRTCRNIKARAASRYISACAVANDVTMQIEPNVHLAMGKGRDTFLPLGDWYTEIDTADLELQTFVNIKEVQRSTTALRIMDEFQAVEYISGFCTLFPGDIIMTGTPAHQHTKLSHGDRVLVRAGEMSLANTVRRE